ncbi:hypothetical protein [Microbacterium caowuchunii]|uniref:Uncharacterized protein n=1 Tax=Microbacterium caowuchunii TaxID=2614638 RepID=A0A5N0TIB9_9MICO|nr:hypothetical protein [Microbacterium caowuchunii]KAA9133626.1 hypothetical protein F6B40_09490 [Microbacterium caowuchunii]
MVTAAVATAIVLVILFNVGGQFYPVGEGVPPIELWVAGVCLNLIAAFRIVHVAVFGRWPLPTPAAPAAAEAAEDALAY